MNITLEYKQEIFKVSVAKGTDKMLVSSIDGSGQTFFVKRGETIYDTLNDVSYGLNRLGYKMTSHRIAESGDIFLVCEP